jgi:nicotinate-nucleotide pyrophosphorylase (carboxylating)
MKTIKLPEDYVNTTIEVALKEDLGQGDITSNTLIPCDLQGKASILIKEQGVIAGVEIAKRVFVKVDRSLTTQIEINDGTRVKPGDVAMIISGNVRSILSGERVALNFLQRMSGIASTTSKYVVEVRGLGVDIADTRKTTPGLRLLEKYAVRMGGGRNHRVDLSDAILIKDNHIAALRSLGMGFKEIVAKAKSEAPPEIKIEVEATTIQEVKEALEAQADIIMLDNMSTGDMIRAVELVAGRAEVEGSGGINLNNVHAAAETGVDFISVGALTHSYKALDISLELEPQTFMLI